ncbi:MAG: TRAP transporter small permease subunit [Geminicoccaceae bacterium]
MRGIIDLLVALDRLLGRLEWLVAGLCMVTIVVSTALGVLFRDMLDAPLAWANDLGVLALLWLTFIGASALYKEQGHIAVDAMAQMLPDRARQVVGTGLVIMMGAVIAITGWEMVVLVELQATKKIPSLGLPRSFNGIPVLWMAASMTLASVARLLRPAAARTSLPATG